MKLQRNCYVLMAKDAGKRDTLPSLLTYRSVSDKSDVHGIIKLLKSFIFSKSAPGLTSFYLLSKLIIISREREKKIHPSTL